MNQNRCRIIISMLVLVLLIGCEAKPERQYFGKKVEIAGGIEDKSFELFWNDFRKAVLVDDMENLGSLTQFKLEAHGSSESDPTILYGEKEFPVVFHAYLRQMSGEEGKQIEKESELIERTKILTTTDQKDKTKVGGMEFNKVNGNWKLISLQLDVESIDEIMDNLNNK